MAAAIGIIEGAGGSAIESIAGSEGSFASEAFAPDSESSATTGGVNVGKIIVQGLSLAGSVLSLVTAIKKGQENESDVRDNRYAAGLLTKKEDRDEMLRKGLIPPYYAKSNIIRLLIDDTIPFGWNLATLVGQGFSQEVALQQRRHAARKLAKEHSEGFKRRLAIKSAENQLNLQKETRASERLSKAIRGSVS